MKTYFISGLGADKRVFQHVKLPHGYEPVFLDWIAPEKKDETLQAYAIRFADLITEKENFILIGLSFGGMLASEIARIKNPYKTIIISSLASSDELPWYFKRAGKFGLHKTLPVNFLKAATLLNRVMGAGTPQDKAIVYHFVKNAHPSFIRWSLNAIVNWNQQERLPGLIHLHGDKDHLLPVKFTHPDYTVKNGGHLMVLNKAEEVNKVLQQVLSGKNN
jgi:pimeloyl-ACP methyl ester carboxylesterase